LLAPRLAGRDAALRWTLFPSLHEPSRECGANADHGGPSTGTAPAVSRWLSVRPLPAGASEGIHLVRATACFERHPSEALKHTGRLAKVLERERARALGAHDAYGVSRAGEVLSGTAGCLFWAVGEEVYTPPPSGGLLDSVVRAALVADGCARPRRLDASDLDVPSEVLWANSLHGVLAVRSLEGRPSPLLGPSGPAFRRLSQRFEALAARSRVPLAGE
jgi:branched-subunit amino acid aminotransferase/4-amino-4-deoxychorismate lyase